MTECNTVKCHKDATKTLEIVHTWTSDVTGTEKETVFGMGYCDQHAKMWLKLDGVANTRYREI